MVRFDFLWKEEEEQGHIDGKKDRPCAIILATKPNAEGAQEVILGPITHSPPHEGETGMEIPEKLAHHLKLDDDQSWVKTHQVNTVAWERDRLPYGIVPAHKGEWIFGKLPQSFAKKIFKQIKDNVNTNNISNSTRK